MKKLVFGIIVIFSLFATKLAFGECYFNYPYEWRLVTYCVWNSNDNWNYYYNWNYNVPSGGYYMNGSSQYYSNNDYSNDYRPYYNDNPPCRTDEENYYNLLYMNWLGSGWKWIKESEPFKDNVIWKEVELEKIDAVAIKSYKFSKAANSKKYSDSKNFMNALKEEVKTRYNDWRISYYKVNDIIHEMDFLTYHLNNEFDYLKKYETTWKKMYKDSYLESATQVKAKYEKLKYTLRN